MLQRLFHIETDEEVIDPETGEPYRRVTGYIGSDAVEVHEDLVEGRYGKYHARLNSDPMTAEAKMDEGGLMGWFKRTFGG